MMYRRNNQQEDADLLEARRRLQASLLAGDAATGGGGVMDGSQQRQLQLQLLEQQILQDARTAAGFGGAPAHHPPLAQQQQQQQLQQQLFQQQLQLEHQQKSMGQHQQQMSQQRLLQQHQQQQLMFPSSGLSGPLLSSSLDGGDSASRANSYATMLGEHRLAIQKAQLEVQKHAQAQAQAEARIKALLTNEAQVQDQMRLLRQRQLASPSTQSNFSSSAYDMLSSGAARSLELMPPRGSGSELSASQLQLPPQDNSLLAARLHASASQRANLLGVQGATTGVPPPQTNNVLPTTNQDDALVFDKISRENKGKINVPNTDARQHTRALSEASSKQDDDDDDDDDDDGDDAKEAPAESDDDEEELDDEEYFKVNAGEPGADGEYPIAREAFPIKLYRILYEAEQNKQDDVISFFSHGRAFAVHKSKDFTRDIMPKYFPAGRMNTFLKQLNLYGFRRITEGRDKGGYFHKDFFKGKRHLCKKIKRKKVHVNKAPPPAPVQAAQQSQLQHSTLQSQLPFLESLGGLGNLTVQHQLLQQQQQQMALGLQGASANSSLFSGSNSLFSASSDLSQAYVQGLRLQSPEAGLGLHQPDFNMNLNFNPNNNPNLR